MYWPTLPWRNVACYSINLLMACGSVNNTAWTQRLMGTQPCQHVSSVIWYLAYVSLALSRLWSYSGVTDGSLGDVWVDTDVKGCQTQSQRACLMTGLGFIQSSENGELVRWSNTESGGRRTAGGARADAVSEPLTLSEARPPSVCWWKHPSLLWLKAGYQPTAASGGRTKGQWEGKTARNDRGNYTGKTRALYFSRLFQLFVIYTAILCRRSWKEQMTPLKNTHTPPLDIWKSLISKLLPVFAIK